MSTTRSNPEPVPGGRSAEELEGDLPDWLKALNPEDEANQVAAPKAQPTKPAPPTSGAAAAPRGQTPTARPAAEASLASSLVDAEDLPDWLKALAESPPAPAPEPPAAPEQAVAGLPSWAVSGDDAGPMLADSPAAAEAPPVWSARRARPAEPMTSGGALFSELAAPPAEERVAASAAAGQGGQLRLLLLVVLLAVLIVVGVVVYMTMLR